MKLKPETQWLLLPKPDIKIERSTDPSFLQLDAAVAWVKEHKPLLWVGSIFSVPEPSSFPSGYAITRSLFDLIFPSREELPETVRERIITELIPRWPLEALLDQFESLHYDLSESLLTFFAAHNHKAFSNALHDAIVRYYENGLGSIPLCVTTNWDTLIEKAFRAKGYKVNIGGLFEMPRNSFGKGSLEDKVISIYHPHGSFETKDVVCSSFQEQQQLALSMEIKSHPMLFLGYSGYEPSLYRHLESRMPQLWCIRNKTDLEIPAKRRLLCRPNTYVFVGDMLELLEALGVLNEKINIETQYLRLEGKIPQKVIDVIHSNIFATIEPRFCTDLLLEILSGFYDEPEATFRFAGIINAIENHIRNRQPHTELPLALIAATRFRNHEQLWINFLSYLLRFGRDIRTDTFDLIFDNVKQVRQEHNRQEETNNVEVLFQARTRAYMSFIGRSERKDDDVNIKDAIFSQIPSIYLGDMALGGELCELAAFACLRDGEVERAHDYFDTAATSYYLMGLWNGGKLNEWASNNIESLIEQAKSNSLSIPMKSRA